jgi:hypothetical protein
MAILQPQTFVIRLGSKATGRVRVSEKCRAKSRVSVIEFIGLFSRAARAALPLPAYRPGWLNIPNKK